MKIFKKWWIVIFFCQGGSMGLLSTWPPPPLPHETAEYWIDWTMEMDDTCWCSTRTAPEELLYMNEIWISFSRSQSKEYECWSFSIILSLLNVQTTRGREYTRIPQRKNIRRIYIAANSGARIGMAESLKKRFKVAWADPTDPTLGYRCVMCDKLFRGAWWVSMVKMVLQRCLTNSIPRGLTDLRQDGGRGVVVGLQRVTSRWGPCVGWVGRSMMWGQLGSQALSESLSWLWRAGYPNMLTACTLVDLDVGQTCVGCLRGFAEVLLSIVQKCRCVGRYMGSTGGPI